jgi:hypothetical protein
MGVLLMWRVAFITDDKRLARALKALVGHAITVETPVPLIGAKTKGGHLVEDAITNETIIAGLSTTFTTEQFRNALQTAGLSSHPTGAHARLKSLIKDRLIRRQGTGRYFKSKRSKTK